jgi:ParB-like nuclease domain
MLGMFELSTTGVPAIDARADFARARRSHLRTRALGWLTVGRHGQRGPKTLGDTAAVPHGAPRAEVVPLKAIVGSVEPSISFDARFRPASEVVRARWERVALAHRTGKSLPPIAVRRSADGYYVVDGRHRVSVALALGRRDIDAWVTDTRSPVGPALATAA